MMLASTVRTNASAGEAPFLQPLRPIAIQAPLTYHAP